MDNSQFRNLLEGNPTASSRDATSAPNGCKKPATLGSRARASIPMTPRSITGQNTSKLFAQQVSDYRKEHDGQPPAKKFRTYAPKGTKLGSGYQDRTLGRREDGETQDDKQKRLNALEEMHKLQQIDEATFENLKNELGIGGDLSSTHLVKGLDWKLLGRIRRGDDLDGASEPEKEEEAQKIDVDEELDHALEKDVQAISHASRKVQDESVAQFEQPATRDEILQKLKESRAVKQERLPPEPALGDRFKKVASDKTGKKKFVESINGRRREVLVVTNRDGTTKRKTRWLDQEDNIPKSEKNQPLGMEVPAEFLAKQQALLTQEADDNEDDDIFQGVSGYDPLAGINSDSESDGKEDCDTAARIETNAPSTSGKPRNYFATSNQDEEAEDRTNPMLKDPTILSALKRAAGLQRHEDDGDDETGGSGSSRAAKQQQILDRLKEQNRADAADLDLGFGESRFGDDEDQDGDNWDDGEGSSKKTGRKHRPKKRKGDKDSVSDVMAVLQGREKKP